jgi:hypothetical protein
LGDGREVGGSSSGKARAILEDVRYRLGVGPALGAPSGFARMEEVSTLGDQVM